MQSSQKDAKYFSFPSPPNKVRCLRLNSLQTSIFQKTLRLLLQSVYLRFTFAVPQLKWQNFTIRRENRKALSKHCNIQVNIQCWHYFTVFTTNFYTALIQNSLTRGLRSGTLLNLLKMTVHIQTVAIFL